MKTLYDLLTALPGDDAEGLRAAFRRAVKGAHPDLRPGDPDAALKFRQIVRASEILGDAEQRAAYDDLLEAARLEHASATEHPIAARIHKLASGVIALSGASVVMVGGYLLFMHMSAASVASANDVDVSTRASLEIATVSPAGAPPAISAGTSIPGKPIVPSAAMRPTKAESVPAADIGRTREISAYRNGDLNVASADPDQAFQLDPKFLPAYFLPAYVDRGVILYRTQKLNHVFPDAARANRVEKANRSKSAPTMARKPVVDQAASAPSMTPSSRQRTAAQDSSRNEGFASAMLR
jgi:curved DNA-binding protein CbpA